MNRVRSIAVDASVLEPGCALDLATIPNFHILYISCIGNHHIIADGADRRGHLPDIILNQSTQPCNHLRTVAVQSHHIGSLCRQTVIYHHLPSPGLIQHGNLNSISKRSISIRKDYIHILDEGPLSDNIICDIVLDILYAAVVTHGNIVKSHVIKAGMLLHPSGKRELPVEQPKTDVSRKTRIAHIFSGKTILYHYFTPVLASTGSTLQLSYFLFGKLSIIIHKLYF